MPTVSVQQMREVDRLMVEEFGIVLLQMMENAGRALAQQARRMLNGDTGEAYRPAIRAAVTLTLALPKAGLVQPAARPWVGELYVADISVPPAIYRRLGIAVGPIFAETDIVHIAR